MRGDSRRGDILLWNAELDLELDLGKVNPQFEADVENQDGADGGEDDAGGMIPFVFGRKSRWVTAPPRSDPMMPRTIVQKRLMCTCMTDFEMTPAISPISRYQIK
jgi:hypothetical protein